MAEERVGAHQRRQLLVRPQGCGLDLAAVVQRRRRLEMPGGPQDLLVRKFEWDDIKMTQSKDLRVANWQTASHGFTADNPSLVGDDWGKNGSTSVPNTPTGHTMTTAPSTT